jgi:squalene-hopene/tetraprenyl-beta-curcumene cyclase
VSENILRAGLMLAIMLAPGSATGADWSAPLVAQYLDGRQRAWLNWKPAFDDPGGPCISCHTGVPYLMARPSLRLLLSEKGPTEFETALLDGVRRRVPLTTPKQYAPHGKESEAIQFLGAESVLAALLLVSEDRRLGKGLSATTEKAFERLWAQQVQSGPDRGGWSWNSLQLDPWEETHSSFYGTALAAAALGTAPPEYRQRPEVVRRSALMTGFLRGQQNGQPLHNRLTLAWASTHLPEILSREDLRRIVQETWSKQEADGGWTLESLGPWSPRGDRPNRQGSDAYATAYTAYILQAIGGPAKDTNLERALAWLRSRQDPKGGFWDATSMNKKYTAGTMPSLFMRDAATAFAVMALAGKKD